MMPVVLRCACLLVAAAALSSAWADERPHRRPGLWEITRPSVDAGNPARTTQVCIDARTEAMLRDVGASFARSIAQMNPRGERLRGFRMDQQSHITCYDRPGGQAGKQAEHNRDTSNSINETHFLGGIHPRIIMIRSSGLLP